MPQHHDGATGRHWEGSVPRQHAGDRLDQVLAQLVPRLSRAQAQRLIREGHCKLDGKLATPATKVGEGACISLHLVEPRSSPTVTPHRAPLDILHEDEAIVAINKAPGVVVHPARGAGDRTLLNALAAHLGPDLRPTLVHRLDRDTSGAVLAGEIVEAHRELTRQLDAGRLTRTYWALVWGIPAPQSGRIEAPLAADRGQKTRMTVSARGKPAITHYCVLKTVGLPQGSASLLEVKLETGRTHQIRAHFEWAGHPLLGDRLYRGDREDFADIETRLPGQALHSRRLTFDHPTTRSPMVVEADLPETLRKLFDALAVAGAVLAVPPPPERPLRGRGGKPA